MSLRHAAIIPIITFWQLELMTCHATTSTVATPFQNNGFQENVAPKIAPINLETSHTKHLPFDWNAEQIRLKSQLAQQQNRPIRDLPNPELSKLSGTGTPIQRKLDLADATPDEIETIRKQYGLVVSRRYVDGRAGQNYIGSVAYKGGEQYYSHGTVKPGMYDVFEFSPRSLELLSQYEEDALRKQNLDPQSTLIKEIVFGIIRQKRTPPKLGVKKLILNNQQQ